MKPVKGYVIIKQEGVSGCARRAVGYVRERKYVGEIIASNTEFEVGQRVFFRPPVYQLEYQTVVVAGADILAVLD